MLWANENMWTVLQGCIQDEKSGLIDRKLNGNFTICACGHSSSAGYKPGAQTRQYLNAVLFFTCLNIIFRAGGTRAARWKKRGGECLVSSSIAVN